MTDLPQEPEPAGAETHVAKDAVGPVQVALSATFNACAGGALEDVDRDLRERLTEAGVLDAVSEDWLLRAADRIRRGEQVVAEPRDD